MKLRKKIAAITGGSSGIGLAMADAYGREGASVVIFGRNADTLAGAQRQLGDSVLAVQGDVTDGADLERLFATTAERFGKVDVLVANAGGINFTPLGQTSEEDFDTASDLNFKAAFFTVQAALSHLADGASVIVIGNALASRPVVGPSVAIAAKAAVTALARTFAVELAPRGIRVNVLSPGPTATAASTPGEIPDDMTVQITKQIPWVVGVVLKTSRGPRCFSPVRTPPTSPEPTSTLAEASAWAGFPDRLAPPAAGIHAASRHAPPAAKAAAVPCRRD